MPERTGAVRWLQSAIADLPPSPRWPAAVSGHLGLSSGQLHKPLPWDDEVPEPGLPNSGDPIQAPARAGR